MVVAVVFGGSHGGSYGGGGIPGISAQKSSILTPIWPTSRIEYSTLHATPPYEEGTFLFKAQTQVLTIKLLFLCEVGCIPH